MDCLANIRFLDALDQPINGLVHQLWVGQSLISDYVTTASGESVWIKRPIGTIIDVRVRGLTSGEYKSKVKIQLVGEKTTFIIRSPKVLLKGVNLSAKDVPTGTYIRSTYIVAEGDYLSRIAVDNNTTTAELIRINNLKSDTDIHAGQVLKIPVNKANKPTPIQENKPKPPTPKPINQEKTKIVVVQQTDTLPLIAKLTGNTVDEIKKLSNLTSDRLSQNQKLRVYDRQVTAITKPADKPHVEKKKEAQKPATPPAVKQDSSKNKEQTPTATVEAEETVLSAKNSARNEKNIASLHPQIRGKVRQLLKQLYIDHKIHFVITEAYRTISYQDGLYALGRTKPGKQVTKAKGGTSYHNYGLAVDIYPVIDGKINVNDAKTLIKVSATGKALGFEWGGDWKTIKDYPHYQITFGKSVSQLYKLTKANNDDPLSLKL
ncbi:M15 family metallopeptidase [Acinetobacter bereziniae]|uniref:LysM peptidoglycan-binding domain-containing protein n=1 Tax=Acinetobacter bereziniae TaxID=106648 RepID=UPI0021CD5ED8|nr:LysM peptidoglycan-binding domain-containing protein [Acinetobacter bereziniae]MCU4320299.1 M15 family metallopeptidase [Acinetobacter bereziniae]